MVSVRSDEVPTQVGRKYRLLGMLTTGQAANPCTVMAWTCLLALNVNLTLDLRGNDDSWVLLVSHEPIAWFGWVQSGVAFNRTTKT